MREGCTFHYWGDWGLKSWCMSEWLWVIVTWDTGVRVLHDSMPSQCILWPHETIGGAIFTPTHNIFPVRGVHIPGWAWKPRTWLGSSGVQRIGIVEKLGQIFTMYMVDSWLSIVDSWPSYLSKVSQNYLPNPNQGQSFHCNLYIHPGTSYARWLVTCNIRHGVAQ